MISSEEFSEFKTKEIDLGKDTEGNESDIQSQTMPLHDTITEIKGANNDFKQEDHNLHNTFQSFQTPNIQQNDNQDLKKIQNHETIQFTSNDEYQKIITENYKLAEIIKNLQIKLKTLKIQTKLQIYKITQEKDEEISDLKNQLNQIQSLLQLKTVEMKDRCNKIQSLTTDSSLNEMQLESDSSIEINQKNQEIKQLKQRNESLRSLNYELTKKNDENESNIKSLSRINEKFNALLLKCKQKITELIQDKNENGLQIELLREKEIQSENQIQELKDSIQKMKEKYKKKIYRLKLDNNTKIKDLILNKKSSYYIQNLNYETQIKKFEELINKQQNDLEEKENLISKLKNIVSDNQDKINKMENEAINLNKQLKICEENDQQIIDIIQSYKIQYFEIRILLKKINDTNHPIKNQICALILDLDKMINENQNKNIIINDLKKEIKNANIESK